MANRDPLVIVSGRIRQLPAGDTLTPNPQSLTFGYSAGKLVTVTASSGTKTLAYSSGKLSTISDTGSGTLSTFAYSGSQLDSITVTPL
jgi:hypothetical protein